MTQTRGRYLGFAGCDFFNGLVAGERDLRHDRAEVAVVAARAHDISLPNAMARRIQHVASGGGDRERCADTVLCHFGGFGLHMTAASAPRPTAWCAKTLRRRSIGGGPGAQVGATSTRAITVVSWIAASACREPAGATPRSSPLAHADGRITSNLLVIVIVATEGCSGGTRIDLAGRLGACPAVRLANGHAAGPRALAGPAAGPLVT
ncbi:MAG: hypothetical protein ACK5BN_22855 [Planctomycetota bacterium]